MPRDRYSYDYPRPAVTVDAVMFTLRDDRLHVLLIRRAKAPYAGSWALPGGFLEIDEPAEVGACRELREETGIEFKGQLHEVGFFARPDRDPRGRTISLAFLGFLPEPGPEPRGADDASDACWVPFNDLAAAPLAFDHNEVLARARPLANTMIRSGTAIVDLLGTAGPTASGVDRVFRILLGSRRGAARWLNAHRKAKDLGPGPGHGPNAT
jgi:8-oxo-dGTP diphosphatase